MVFMGDIYCKFTLSIKIYSVRVNKIYSKNKKIKTKVNQYIVSLVSRASLITTGASTETGFYCQLHNGNLALDQACNDTTA